MHQRYHCIVKGDRGLKDESMEFYIEGEPGLINEVKRKARGLYANEFPSYRITSCDVCEICVSPVYQYDEL